MVERVRSQEYKTWDAERKRKTYHRGQQIIRRFKLFKGCAECGYKEHHAALEFNHINRSLKKYTMGEIAHHAVLKNNTKGKLKLKIEMSNCEVLCANCHRIKTFEEKHWNKVR